MASNRRWRWPFRYRGSRRSSMVAQFFSLSMTTLLHTMFLLLIFCGAFGFLLQGIFYSQLRQRHAEVWHALGRPGIFCSIGSGRSVVRFLWRQEYQSISDVRTILLAQLLRGSMAIFAGLFVCTLFVFAGRLFALP